MRSTWRMLAGLLGIAVAATACGESAVQREAHRATVDTEAPRNDRATPPPDDMPAADGECTVEDGEDRSTYTYASGRLARSTWSRDARVTMYSYEGDRLVRVERRTPEESYFIVTIAYDERGRARELSSRSPEETVDGPTESVHRRAFFYRADGRLERMTVDDGYELRTTTLRYDAQGRLVEELEQGPEGDEPARARRTYDGAGRLESVDVETQRWTHRYGASGHIERTTMVDPDGELLSVEERRYDAQGRLIERELADEIERMRYEGTFGSGAECGMLGFTPEGIPDDFPWLGFSP